MSAQALLSEALAAGLHLEIEGVNIAVTPASKLSAGLRARIAAEKPALLELLRAPTGPYVADRRRCAGCGRSGFVVMVVTGCGDHLCRGCWASTTKVSDEDQPPTPTLDRLMGLADQRAERERA
jgi:hypothetical protein